MTTIVWDNEGKPIFQDPIEALRYVVKGRCPECESRLYGKPEWDVYLYHCIKNTFKEMFLTFIQKNKYET